MSHVRQARAHLRHANRAGGFGGFGGGFGGGNDDPLTDLFPPTFSFPGVGETKTKTSETSESTDPAAPTSSAPASDASAAADSTSSASVAETSSTSTTSAIPTTSTTTTSTTPITHSSIPITTTASGTALHDNLTKVVTHVASVTAEAAAANSSTPAAPATSNALVAPVIGGVAGGIVGLALLIFLVTWFMRRRRPDQDAINFDPGTFRRSAMMITDPPTHQDTVDRGYNPATPPAMVERRPIYTQASFDNHVGIHSPNSGSQLVFQAPFSPITNGPNVTSPVSAYDHHSWGAPAPVPVLTRNISGSSEHSAHSQAPPQYAAYPALPSRQNSMRNGQLAPPHNETEYVDLERTSVTPFQAEQYVEISKQLNTEVPKGLDTPTVSQIVAEKMDLPPLPPPEKEDPFADSHDGNQEEGDSTLAMVQDMSFPAPPSPVHTSSSRYARESFPPTLPEIVVQSRVSVTSAYLSEGASSTPGSQTVFMKGPFAESPMGSRFPVTPSPLASSFTVPTPPPAKASFDAPSEPEPAANTQSQARSEPKKRQTVYSTVYDPEDAYGGF